jgi:hypothetical protein
MGQNSVTSHQTIKPGSYNPFMHEWGGSLSTASISALIFVTRCTRSWKKLFFAFPYFYCLGHNLTPWNRVLVVKLIVGHLVKEFPAFYWIRRFITVLDKPPQVDLIVSQLNPVHSLTYIYLRTSFILLAHRSFPCPKLSSPLKFSD